MATEGVLNIPGMDSREWPTGTVTALQAVLQLDHEWKPNYGDSNSI